jgi:HNH endonuclease/AP2 domain
LHYDRKTGEFRWRKCFHNKIRAGDLAGTIQAQGHRFICIDRRCYREHRLAWFYMTGRWGPPNIDHLDGDPSNNRWSNLRRATRSQNNANRRRPRNNTSGFKGVHLCQSSGKWRALIGKNGHIIHLGRFPTPQAAHEAYVAAARKLFGEFARPE